MLVTGWGMLGGRCLACSECLPVRVTSLLRVAGPPRHHDPLLASAAGGVPGAPAPASVRADGAPAGAGAGDEAGARRWEAGSERGAGGGGKGGWGGLDGPGAESLYRVYWEAWGRGRVAAALDGCYDEARHTRR